MGPSYWIPATSLRSLIENSEKALHLDDDTKWQARRKKGGGKQTSYFIIKPAFLEAKSLESNLPSQQ